MNKCKAERSFKQKNVGMASYKDFEEILARAYKHKVQEDILVSMEYNKLSDT